MKHFFPFPTHKLSKYNLKGCHSQSSIPDAVLARLNSPLDQTVHEVLEGRARDLHVHVPGSRSVGRDEGQRNIRLRHSIKLALRLIQKHKKGAVQDEAL